MCTCVHMCMTVCVFSCNTSVAAKATVAAVIHRQMKEVFTIGPRRERLGYLVLRKVANSASVAERATDHLYYIGV